MPATPRDLLKPRQERLAEVFQAIQLQSGQANGQQIISGLGIELPGEAKKFVVEAGEAAFDGVSLPQVVKKTAEQEVAAGATLTSGQNCFVLIEITKAEEPEVKQTVSAITGGTPIVPALTAGRLAVAVLSLKGAFTPGTTKLTAAMVIPVKYSAGNVSPTGGF